MLSHVGLYSGGDERGNVKKHSGALLVKTRKRLLSAIDQDHTGNNILRELCAFDILLALDALMTKGDSEQLCLLVRKYARGQKRGTMLNEHLKLSLRSVLGS